MLERPPARPDRRRQAASARQARRRRRSKAGRIVVAIELDELVVLEALLASGRLTEAQALRRSSVEAELGRLIADWACRWRPRDA